jgi:hypothetical protein
VADARFLADPRRGVRLSAARAYGIRRWPSLFDAVEQLSNEDPEPDVRDFASRVVERVRSEAHEAPGAS